MTDNKGDTAYGVLSESELRRIEAEVSKQANIPERAEDMPGVTFDFTDDELFQVTNIQKHLQEKYAKEPATMQNKRNFSDELITRLADAGFEVVVKWEKVIGESGIPIEYPEVTFLSRLERTSIETDHERKRFDALRTDKEDLPNRQLMD